MHALGLHEQSNADLRSDAARLAQLGHLARGRGDACARSGSARVGFRVGPGGRSWIIDVDVNPGLLPDAGRAAMLAQANNAYGAARDLLQAEAQGRQRGRA